MLIFFLIHLVKFNFPIIIVNRKFGRNFFAMRAKAVCAKKTSDFTGDCKAFAVKFLPVCTNSIVR